jgi:sialidase-1
VPQESGRSPAEAISRASVVRMGPRFMVCGSLAEHRTCVSRAGTPNWGRMIPRPTTILLPVTCRLLLSAPMLIQTFVVSAAADEKTEHVAIDVFISGADGYPTFRIPSLVVTAKGTLLAFCEARKTGRGDDGDIDLVLRRSTDGGKTWHPMQIVHEEGGTAGITIGNPCPVLDQSTGTMWLTFCRNNDEVFVMSSDDGLAWTPPRRITTDVKEPDWGWYATGPGVGIQLTHGPHEGRLVIPCDHGKMIDGKRVMFSHAFFSDDHGQTWKLGGTVAPHTDECQVVELADGELLMNMRNYWGRDGMRPELGGMRAIARSRDGGETWSALTFDKILIEPLCQASLIGFPNPRQPSDTVLLFSNPASREARRQLTVRASFDGGKTWPVTEPIDDGSAAYSCLAMMPDGRIGLLYERDDYKRITFRDFTIEIPTR